MYTLLETCLERLDVFEFITHMENGLKDQHDIKLLTYLMLARLAALCPSQVLQRLDSLCEPLKTQIQARAKANAVKQENDKQDELRRAALRVVVALQHIPEADRQQQFADLLAIIRSSTEINAVYQVTNTFITIIVSSGSFRLDKAKEILEIIWYTLHNIDNF
ncbi:TATA-binding protein interacting [Onchocerca flexuosa]|uniref:TATA-binding protein interacting n=1 Tax=Onchocerca flexuosa TaxID=387005 RepID=A0A238C4J8_9BILA|nr:TATA-binding protein interacting [Onchocerca flexuosa]